MNPRLKCNRGELGCTTLVHPAKFDATCPHNCPHIICDEEQCPALNVKDMEIASLMNTLTDLGNLICDVDSSGKFLGGRWADKINKALGI